MGRKRVITVSLVRAMALAAILAVATALSLPLDMGIASASSIIQLTNNTNDDTFIHIDAGQMAWHGSDGNDWEIFLYDGTTTTQLTNNDYEDYIWDFDTGQVVWTGFDGNDREIFLYDGTTTAQLTDNDYDDDTPRTDSGQVVWYGFDGNDHEIFLYDGSITTHLTNNDYDDSIPYIDAGQVVWRGSDGNDFEIFLYDGSITTQLTNNDYDDRRPNVDAGQVVWYGSDGNDYEIFLYDGSITTQLTNNDYDDLIVDDAIDGGQVAWTGSDGNDWEIFLYDGTTTTQLTNNDYEDGAWDIDTGQVVWYGFDGNDYEIFLYDGSITTQLTNNDYEEYAPFVDAGQAVWTGSDGNDLEVFLYSSDVPNTPVGSPVTVPLNGVSVTFDNVTVAGNTTYTSQQGNPAGGTPSGFRVRGNFVDIETTASYSGLITVCITYDPSTVHNADKLRLFHWDGSAWVDVTTGVDTVNNVICGEVTSLSPFFVGEPYASVTTATGTGTARVYWSAGTLENLAARSVGSVGVDPPEGLIFGHGLFEFDVTGLAAGESVMVTIELPSAVRATAEYWKYNLTDGWYPVYMYDDDGDRIIAIQLTDGGGGDDDHTVNGAINDQGGPGWPPSSGGASGASVFPSIYIGIGAALGAGVLAYFVRRRLAHS